MVEISDVGNGLQVATLNGDLLGVITKSHKYPFRVAFFSVTDQKFLYGMDALSTVAIYCSDKRLVIT